VRPTGAALRPLRAPRKSQTARRATQSDRCGAAPGKELDGAEVAKGRCRRTNRSSARTQSRSPLGSAAVAKEQAWRAAEGARRPASVAVPVPAAELVPAAQLVPEAQVESSRNREEPPKGRLF
jgi:hypothetical protein